MPKNMVKWINVHFLLFFQNSLYNWRVTGQLLGSNQKTCYSLLNYNHAKTDIEKDTLHLCMCTIYILMTRTGL